MKFGLVTICLIISLGLAGCGQNAPPENTPAVNTAPTAVTAGEPAQAVEIPTLSASPAIAQEPTPTPEISLASPIPVFPTATNTAIPTEPILATLDPTSPPVLVTMTREDQAAQATQPPPAAANASLVVALQDQLFLGGIPSDNTIQLGIVKGCPMLDELVALTGVEPKLPYLYNTGRSEDLGQLCLYGLDAGGTLEIKLFRPDGSLAETASLQVDPLSEKIARLVQVQPPLIEEVGFAGFSGGKPLFSLKLWWPAGLPPGEWRLAARNDQGLQAEGVFMIDNYAPQPAIGLTKPHAGPYAAKANPFKRPAVESGCQAVAAGQTVPIYVVNLPPGSAAHLGIYQLIQVAANLVDELPFQVNRKGNQQVDFTIPADWPAGRYYFLLPTVQDALQINKAGPNVCVELN